MKRNIATIIKELFYADESPAENVRYRIEVYDKQLLLYADDNSEGNFLLLVNCNIPSSASFNSVMSTTYAGGNARLGKASFEVPENALAKMVFSQFDFADISSDEIENVENSLTLISRVFGCDITYRSSDEKILNSDTGTISENTSGMCKLIVAISNNGGESLTKTFELAVKNLANGKLVRSNAVSTADTLVSDLTSNSEIGYLTRADKYEIVVDLGQNIRITDLILDENSESLNAIKSYKVYVGIDEDNLSEVFVGNTLSERTAISFNPKDMRYIKIAVLEREGRTSGFEKIRAFFSLEDNEKSTADISDVKELIPTEITTSFTLPSAGTYGSEFSYSTNSQNLSINKSSDCYVITFTKPDYDAETTIVISAKNSFGEISETVNVLLIGENQLMDSLPSDNDDSVSSGSGGGGGGISSAGVRKPENTEEPAKDVAEGKFARELKDHWGKTEIEFLIEKGIVKGSGDSLNLTSNITRAEFITMIVRAYGFESISYKNSFADVLSGSWYADNLQTAFENGVFSGSDIGAEPERAISRQEAAVMISNLFENSNNERKSFIDSDDVSEWAEEGIYKAIDLGLIKGYGPSICSPNSLDSYWPIRISGLTIPQTLCMMYRGMNNEAYLYHAIRFTLISILELRDNFRQIKQPCFNTANRMYTFCEDIYEMIESKYMTPEYFAMMLKWVYIQLEFLVSDWCSEEEPNNIGTICTRGLLEGAMTFREFKAYSAPKTHIKDTSLPGSMQGGWLEVGLFRSLYKLKQTVKDDGSSVEIPVGYINVNLGEFYEPYGLAEKLGLEEEIVSALGTEDIELLRKSVHYVASLNPPNHENWLTGDTGNATSPVGQWMANDLSFFIKDDAVLEWLKSGGKRGNPPSGFTSYVNDNNQRAVLRSSWNKNAVALYTDADSSIGSHGHSDDLAIQIMAYGEYLLVDSGNRDYTADATTNWQVSTRAHNTIEINSCSQAGNDANKSNPGAPTEEPFGEPLFWPNDYGLAQGRGTLHPEKRRLGDIYDYMRAETPTYKGLNTLNGDFTVWRDILFIKPGYFIVTDYIEPENTDVNTYKQAWHFNKNTEFVVDDETKVTSTLSDDRANILVVPVETDEITPVRRTGRYTNGLTFDQEYLTYDKQKSGITTYNTILYPTQAGDSYEIMVRPAGLDVHETIANAFEADIVDKKTGNKKNIAYYTLFDDTKKNLRNFGEYETDGKLAFVEKSVGNYTRYILQEGKKLSVAGGETLVESGNELSNIAVTVEGPSMYIQTENPEELDYNTLKIYMKNRISAVFVNNIPLQYYEQIGNYIYFCETGLANPGTNDSVQNNQPPLHAGGGGGNSSSSKENVENTQEENNKPLENTSESFGDIEHHWAVDYIEIAQQEKLVEGDGSGNFYPNNAITRAEILTMFMRALDVEAVYADEFDDVSEDDWYAETIAKALKLNIISKGNNFRPNDLVTREEMCKIAVGVFETLRNENLLFGDLTYSDKKEISEWALDFVSRATQSGLMEGIGNNKFMPKGSATRAQAVTILVRMLKLIENVDYENQIIETN